MLKEEGGVVAQAVESPQESQKVICRQYTFEHLLKDPLGWIEYLEAKNGPRWEESISILPFPNPPPIPPAHPPRPAWMHELAPLPASEFQEKKVEEPKKKGQLLRTVPFDIQRMRMFQEATPAAKAVLRMLYKISHPTKGRDGFYHRYVNAGVNGLAALTGLSPRAIKYALAYWREKRVIWLLHRGRPQFKKNYKNKCSRYELPASKEQWAKWNIQTKNGERSLLLP